MDSSEVFSEEINRQTEALRQERAASPDAAVLGDMVKGVLYLSGVTIEEMDEEQVRHLVASVAGMLHQGK